jgi:hypothetical protein
MDQDLQDDDTESVDIALDARLDTVAVVDGLRNAQPVVVVWQPPPRGIIGALTHDIKHHRVLSCLFCILVAVFIVGVIYIGRGFSF